MTFLLALLAAGPVLSPTSLSVLIQFMHVQICFNDAVHQGGGQDTQPYSKVNQLMLGWTCLTKQHTFLTHVASSGSFAFPLYCSSGLEFAQL